MRKIAVIFLFFLSIAFNVRAQSVFDKKIAQAVKQLSYTIPSEEEPVTLNASVIVEKDSIAIIVKAGMAPGWHIYQYVPANMPYIPIDLILKFPDDIAAKGKWEMSPSFPSTTDQGVMIYENVAWFVRKEGWPVGKTGDIQTGLYYQTCDHRQCLPPIEKVIDLKVRQ